MGFAVSFFFVVFMLILGSMSAGYFLGGALFGDDTTGQILSMVLMALLVLSAVWYVLKYAPPVQCVPGVFL